MKQQNNQDALKMNNLSDMTNANDLVCYEQSGQNALLVLNRPDKLNALSYALIDALMARLDAIEADPAARGPSARGPTSPASRLTSRPPLSRRSAASCCGDKP